MPSHLRKPNLNLNLNFPRTTLVLLTLVLLLTLYTLQTHPSTLPSPHPPHSPPTDMKIPKAPRIIKATIAYPSLPEPYQRGLKLHEQQNAEFGYEMRVLRAPLVRGAGNVLYFLVGVVVREMERGAGGEGEAWVLYFDPGVIPLFPSHPLHVLLPPAFDPFDVNTTTTTATSSPSDAQRAGDGNGDTDAFEALKRLSLILPSPSPGSSIPPLAPDLTIFWLKPCPTTLEILTAAITSLHTTTDFLGTGRGGDGDGNEGDVDVAAAALHRVLEARGAWGRGEAALQRGQWYGMHSHPVSRAVTRSNSRSVAASGEAAAKPSVDAHPSHGGVDPPGNSRLHEDVRLRDQDADVDRDPYSGEGRPLFARPSTASASGRNGNVFAALKEMESLLAQASRNTDAETAHTHVKEIGDAVREWWTSTIAAMRGQT